MKTKKLNKKILAVLMTVMMCMSGFQVAVFADMSADASDSVTNEAASTDSGSSDAGSESSSASGINGGADIVGDGTGIGSGTQAVSSASDIGTVSNNTAARNSQTAIGGQSNFANSGNNIAIVNGNGNVIINNNIPTDPESVEGSKTEGDNAYVNADSEDGEDSDVEDDDVNGDADSGKGTDGEIKDDNVNSDTGSEDKTDGEVKVDNVNAEANSNVGSENGTGSETEGVNIITDSDQINADATTEPAIKEEPIKAEIPAGSNGAGSTAKDPEKTEESDQEKPEEEKPDIESEVSDTIKAFINAVAALPETVTKENAEEVMILAEGCWAAYDALNPADYDNEAVSAALTKFQSLMETAMTLADADNSNKVSSYDELEAAVEAAEGTPTTINITNSFDLTSYLWIKPDQDIMLTAGEGVALGRSINNYLFYVSGKLTLNNITVDGKGLNSSRPLIYIVAGGTVILENATVQNGINNGNENAKWYYGGGVYNAGTFTMNGNSIISGNSAKSYGGGVYNVGTFTMNGGTISGNKNPTWYGGGVYNAGTFIATGGEISGNEATNTTYGYGGGVYNKGIINMEGGTIYGNTANSLGGGMYSATKITMDGTIISDNVNGGIYIDAALNAGIPSLKSLTVTGNIGSQPALYVGAVDGVLVEDCTITGNTVEGAAVEITGQVPRYGEDKTKYNEAEKVLENCSITDNTCTYATGYYAQKAAVSLASFGKKIVSGCIITNNKAYYGGLLNQTGGALTTICDGTLISYNEGSYSGGLATITSSNDSDAVTIVNGAVIKGNVGDAVGGVFANGHFEFRDGAIYNNAAKNDQLANDLRKNGESAHCTLIKASEMVDSEQSGLFSEKNYIWYDGVDRWDDLSFVDTSVSFSLTAAPKKDFLTNCVYLNGSTGDDNNDGVTLGTPVKSFAKALELWKVSSAQDSEDEAVICVTGTLTQSGLETWDGEGVTLLRYPTFKYALIDVIGGQLTLKNIILDGAYELGVVESSAPLIKLSGGELVLDDGAILQNNVRTGGNKFEGGGGVYANGGILTMKDGSIIRNNYAHNGGGVSLMQNKPVFNMEGGTICNNRTSVNGKYSQSNVYQTSGGGVFIAYDSVMNMSGGTISGNTAYSGAGISLGGPENTSFINDGSKNYHPTLNMTGGVIEGNTAYSNGGGIFVQMNCTATLDARNSGKDIYIQNNHTEGCGGGVNFGGGGIYVNGGKDSSLSNGTLQLYDVEINKNKASHIVDDLLDWTEKDKGVGTAIAACPTSVTKLYVTNGGVIHDNGGIDIFFMAAENYLDYVNDSVTKPDGSTIPTLGLTGRVQFFLSSYMLGGGAYHWSNKDGEFQLNEEYGYVELAPDGSRQSFYAKTNTTGAGVTGTDKCTTHITGNSSGGRGGAIGSNGNVIIGSAPTEDDTTSISLSVDKVWKGDDNDNQDTRPEFVDVRIIAITQDGREIDQGFVRISYSQFKSENNWTASYNHLPRYDENGNPLIYTIREVNVVNYKGEITNCVVTKKDEAGTGSGGSGFNVTALHDVTVNVNLNDEVKAEGSLTIDVTATGDNVANNTYEYSVSFDKPIDSFGGASRLRQMRVASFSSEDSASYVTFDEDGKASIKISLPGSVDVNQMVLTIKGLPVGSYKIETKGEEPQTVEVRNTDKEINFELTNTHCGSLTITKKIAGSAPTETTDKKEYTFTVTADAENAFVDVPYTEGVKIDGNKAIVTIKGEGSKTLEKLVMGTYTVIEDRDNAKIDGYELKVSNEGIVKVELNNADDKVEATITNTYDKPKEPEKPTPIPSIGSLTITKIVQGGGSAAANKVYTFTVTGLEGYSENVTITGSGSKTLDGLKAGTYTITEDSDSAAISGYRWSVAVSGDVVTVNGASASVTVNEGKNAKAAAVTFTNNYRRPPTDPEDPTPQNPPEDPSNPPEEPPTDVPDPDVPLVNIPEEEPPLTEIPEEEPPLANIPEEEPPLVDIPEEEPPLSEIPEEEPPLADMPPVEILDGDVPKTGDTNSALLWLVMSLMALFGMGTVLTESCVRRRRK